MKRHPHDTSAHPLKGLLDGVPTVRYNTGGKNDQGGEDKFVDAIVLHEGDGKNLILGRFNQGKLEYVNDGKPVTERAESDYGPEGGGVTWTH